MKYSAYIMGFFVRLFFCVFFFIFSFEGAVAYLIRYSIIMACDHSFSVLYTHLGEKLGAEA